MKLVRDLIPEQFPEGFTYHQAAPTERLLLLHLKLAEEVGEVLSATPGEFLGEMADLFEVAEALLGARGWSLEDLSRSRRDKAALRGGFIEGWVLE